MVDFINKDIEWSEETHSVSDFRDKRLQLPAVIKITAGYYGKTNFEEFSSDEILVLYEWRTEERIQAKNKKQKTISLPIDMDHNFHITTPDKTLKIMPLSNVIKEYKPPVKASFDPKSDIPFYINDEPFSTDGFGSMWLMSSHYLEYVTASTTVHGKVCLESLVCLPVYRKVRFVIAEKVKGMSMADLKPHLTSFMHIIDTLRTKPKKPGREEFTEHKLGIVDYNEMLDTLEEYVYLRHIPRGPWGRVNITPSGIMPREAKDTRVKFTQELSEAVITKGGKSFKNTFSFKHLPSIKNKKSRPPSHNAYETIDEALQTKKPKAVVPRQVIPEESQRIPPDRSPSPKPAVPPRRGSIPSRRPQLPVVLPNRLVRAGSVQDEEMYDEIVGPPPETKPRALKEDTSKPPVPIKKPLPKRQLSSTTSPDPKRRPIHETNPSPNTPGDVSASFLSLNDVPPDRGNLTVGEVCQCLNLLQMREHVPKFRHMQVDGRLLREVSAQSLIESFDMSRLAARKLKLFSDEGWVPKEGVRK